MDRLQQLSEKKAIRRLNAFFESAFFPVLLGAVVFLFYALNMPIASLTALALCALFICLFAKDTRAGLAVLLFAMISFRYKDNGGAYTSTGAIVTYAVFGPLTLAAALYRLFARRVEYKRKGLLSIALLCVALLLGGVFTKYYTAANIALTIGYTGALFGAYLFFALTMQSREDNLVYLARICAIAICIISLQVGELYLRLYDGKEPLDWIWKEKIILGWSISNMVGEMVVFLLPTVFYLIYKEKRGYLYWIVVALGVIAVYFTYGRNALLWCAIVVATCSLVNCFIGPHKKINRIVVLLAVLAFGGLVLTLWKTGYLKNITTFFVETGFQDRGRFALWKGHFELFKEHPVFGVGFKAFHSIMQGREHNAHNNLLQMLSSTGIIGLVLYLIHRVHTVILFKTKRTAARMFIGSCILVGVLLGVLSSVFFHIYFMVYYAIILLCLEKSLDE